MRASSTGRRKASTSNAQRCIGDVEYKIMQKRRVTAETPRPKDKSRGVPQNEQTPGKGFYACPVSAVAEACFHLSCAAVLRRFYPGDIAERPERLHVLAGACFGLSCAAVR
ncbi:hypothetical protein NQZ68_012779 [Dissostichus eleginoides]|nr:hypothetical protein NQZ68_012779 [Dissostichus eleginoides]